MRASALAFHRLGERLVLHRGYRLSLRQFKAHFGVSPRVVAAIWKRIDRRDLAPAEFLPSHLLWTLLFLKLYSCEDVLASLVGTTRLTFRKWVWIGIAILGDLDLVSSLW